MNSYALLQDILHVLDKHGLDVDDVHTREVKPSILAPRGAKPRVVVEVRGSLR